MKPEAPKHATFGEAVLFEFDMETINERGAERALSLLCTIYKKEISGLLDALVPNSPGDKMLHGKEYSSFEIVGGYFYKAFRQQDIIEDDTKGLTDMVLWNLFNESRLFEECLKRICQWNEYILANPEDDEMKSIRSFSHYF